MSEELELRAIPRRPLPTPKQVGLMLWRQKWVMLLAAVTVAVGMWQSGIWKQSYAAQMKILVLRNRVDAVLTPEANSPVAWGGDQVSEEDLNSEVELLTSDDLLREVAVKAGLTRDPALGPQASEPRRVAAAAYLLGKHLKTQGIRKTNVISVQYESDKPEQATKILNALAEAYVAKHQEVHRPTGEFKFFDGQTARYRAALVDARTQLVKLSEGTGVAAPEMERDLSIQRAYQYSDGAQQARVSVEEGGTRLAVLERQLAATPARLRATEHTADDAALLGQMGQTLNQLELKRAEMAEKYTPQYRPLQELDAQIAVQKDALERARKNPAHQETTEPNPNYQALEMEVAKAKAEISGLSVRSTAQGGLAAHFKQTALTVNRMALEREELMQDAKVDAENYVLYMHKREEARISDALDQRGIVNVAVVEHPTAPSFPKHTPTYAAMMTLLLCFTVSGAAAVGADSMAGSFRTPEEAAAYLETPVLVCLPKEA